MFVRKLVEIDERWEKIGNDVYRLWRIVPETEWTRELTPYKEIPVQIIDLSDRDRSIRGCNERREGRDD